MGASWRSTVWTTGLPGRVAGCLRESSFPEK